MSGLGPPSRGPCGGRAIRTAGACPAAGQMCMQAGRFGFFVLGLLAARLGVCLCEGPGWGSDGGGGHVSSPPPEDSS